MLGHVVTHFIRMVTFEMDIIMPINRWENLTLRTLLAGPESYTW